jgi:hypothetical protein
MSEYGAGPRSSPAFQLLSPSIPISPTLLAKCYEQTWKDWRRHYGVPYSICGCTLTSHLGEEAGLFAKLSLKTGIGGAKEGSPTKNPRGDLLSVHEKGDDIDLTHVWDFGVPAVITAPAISEGKKKKVKEGSWEALQAKRKEERRHVQAFTGKVGGLGAYAPYWKIASEKEEDHVIS